MALSLIRTVSFVCMGVIVGSSLVLVLHWMNRASLNISSPINTSNYSTPHHRSPQESKLESNESNNNDNSKLLRQHYQVVKQQFSLKPSVPLVTCHGQYFHPSEHNVFIYHSLCNVSSGNDIVQFSGPQITEKFDIRNKKLHYRLNPKVQAWSDIAKDINQTKQLGINQSVLNVAVHMHNYHKLGDFMLLFWTEYWRSGPSRKSLKKNGKFLPLTAEQLRWAVDKDQPPVVVTNWGDENWGFLSGRK